MAELVSVKGYWRTIGARKKKRAPAKPPAVYYVAESNDGRTCGHHHRTRAAARRCSNDLQRKERAAHARLTRRQAKTTRMRRWDVDQRKGGGA